MKLFLAGLLAECNSYAPMPTGLGAFEAEGIRRGPASGVDPGGYLDAIESVRRTAAAAGCTVEEGLFAAAQPLGPVDQRVYEALRDELLADLERACPVQAVVLMLHGAMTAEHCDDCEGELLQRVRRIVGPLAPIGVVLDLHCHFTERMRANASLLVAYKQYPHTDIAERAADTTRLTLAAAAGRIRPVTGVYDCRMAGSWHTTREPMQGFVARMQAMEGRGGVLSVSLGHGFAFGDVPDAGTKLWVVTDGDLPLAERTAAELGRQLWDLRDAITTPTLGLDAALDVIVARGPQSRAPVVIADMADNPGGGARGDSTFALERLVRRGIGNVALGGLWDMGAVQLCREAGVGATFALRIGGKCGPASGQPVDLRVTVRALADDHAQTAFGSRTPLGASAWVATAEGLDIVLISRCQQTIGCDLFTGLGIDLAAKRAVVVKSMQHFHAAFAPLASEVLYADSPGLLTSDIAALPFRHRNPNFWPRVADPFNTSAAP
jgi:microcystin degradation protein MlrC